MEDRVKTIADKSRIENEMAWEDRDVPSTLYGLLNRASDKFPNRSALSFQLLSDPKSPAATLNWKEFRSKTVQAANLLRSLGIDEKETVAYLLPNSIETAIVLVGGAIAGIVSPINPLLDTAQIAAILRDLNAKVLVTLKAFPKTDISQKAAEAVALAPSVETVLEVDLNSYLSFPKSWIVPFLRPKTSVRHSARVLDLGAELAKQRDDDLSFEDKDIDRFAACFHTGGTTGMPKIAQHKYSGIIFNGWCGANAIASEDEVIICPLPLFHVFASYPILTVAIASGSHVVLPTPAGYRGEGVFDNFWKLVERWKVTFIVTVPTAASALMQRPVDADISSLKTALCGSAPMPTEMFKRFEKLTGVKILEGYGLTEATCLVSVNPLQGERKIGSVGLPFPYVDVRILNCDSSGKVESECESGDIGEICVSSPGVVAGGTYREASKNDGLYADGKWLRTGDLGKVDDDGYIWITGRAKDLIIRGGRNIDPALIEEALSAHDAVAFVGAIGQPHRHLGEVPCAYVELVENGHSTGEELREFAVEKISDKDALPRVVEILPELPKTAVGKVFKPDLRKKAIARVLAETLKSEKIDAVVASVEEVKNRGLVARVSLKGDKKEKSRAADILGEFSFEWEFSDG
ncbi:MAG: acyl-CoA synthetase [Albidovulum sp.]|nr:acyl-CoA synthetase [Albidovulum sp.]